MEQALIKTAIKEKLKVLEEGKRKENLVLKRKVVNVKEYIEGMLRDWEKHEKHYPNVCKVLREILKIINQNIKEAKEKKQKYVGEHLKTLAPNFYMDFTKREDIK